MAGESSTGAYDFYTSGVDACTPPNSVLPQRELSDDASGALLDQVVEVQPYETTQGDN